MVEGHMTNPLFVLVVVYMHFANLKCYLTHSKETKGYLP
jgi:hypothetical protein